MKSAHPVSATYREASVVIDLHEVFSDYWSSNNHDFTVMSPSSSPTSPCIFSDKRTEDVVIEDYSGPLELQFSVNDTVRPFAAAHPRQLIIFA